MNTSKIDEDPSFRTISGIGLVVVRKLGKEIRGIVVFDEVISERHCS